MAAQIGLDPSKDINWVDSGPVDPMQLFVDGKIDAFLSYPPQAQELRARHVGRVLLKTAEDHPWSQYFCCMLAGNREFVRNHPVTTKHVRAPSSRPPTCAPANRTGSRSGWSIAGSLPGTTMPSRR